MLSDFLVGRVIQVNLNGFLSNQIHPEAEVPQDFVLSQLLFLIYVNELPAPHHKQNSLSQFADDSAQWAFSLNVRFATFATGPSRLGNVVCQMEKQAESRRNQRDHILQVQTRQETEPNLKLYGEILKVYPQVNSKKTLRISWTAATSGTTD